MTRNSKSGDEWTVSDPVEVTVRVTDDGVGNMNGAVTYNPADKTITNDHTRTRVKVSKVDIASGVELAGAAIQIIDRAGNVVDEWVSKENEVHESEFQYGQQLHGKG